MKRIAYVTIASLCSPMFAAAYGGDVTRDFCKGFETKLERLCDIDETSCDRLTTAFNAACGAVGTIYASPAADSPALDLLRENYDVVRSTRTCRRELSPHRWWSRRRTSMIRLSPHC